MATTDPRIDAYIEHAAPFAQPILAHLRRAVHAACPDVVETIKWSMPFFVRADGSILANMAAFKQHCAFGFWRGSADNAGGKAGEAMGQFGRIESLKDLPPARELKALIQVHAARPAARSNAKSAAPKPAKKAAPRPEAPVPPDLAAALAKVPAARQAFEAFPPSHRREYVEWIVEAKRDETRAKRIAQALEWLAEGRSRHWKYQR